MNDTSTAGSVTLVLDPDLREELQKDADEYTEGDLSRMIDCRLRLAQFVRPKHGRGVRVTLWLESDEAYKKSFEQMQGLMRVHVWTHAISLPRSQRVIELNLDPP
jgi:hypothetical protein